MAIASILELWITKNTNLKIKAFNIIHTSPTDKRAVGVAIVIRNNLEFKVVNISNLNDGLEFIFIDLLLPGHTKPLRIGSIYIHPTAKSGTVKRMMERTNDNTILMGISTPTPPTGVYEFPTHEEHN